MRLLHFLILCLFLATSCSTCSTGDANIDTDTDADGIVDMLDMPDEDADGIVDIIDEPINAPSEYIAGIPVYNTFDEIEYIFQQENDTTYLINFWATWCKPCVEEMPFIEKINKEYADEKVKVLLVSMDFKKLASRKLLPFIEKNKIESEVVLLADGMTSKWIDRVSTHWDGAIPYSIIYNQFDRKEMSIAHTYSDIDQIVRGLVDEEKTNNALPANYDDETMEANLDENGEPFIEDSEPEEVLLEKESR